jgi:heme-degrading monooxygenase HmoA
MIPPVDCYAVIFSSTLGASQGYAEAAAHMLEVAASQPGYLGVQSARGADGFGITVSYWRSEADIAQWRNHVEHTAIRARGRSLWYSSFQYQVTRVLRSHASPMQESRG